MNYKTLILFIFLYSCSVNNFDNLKKEKVFDKGFSNTGFALVYSQDLKDNKIVSKSINNESLIIFQKNLKKDTPVKITNLNNNKSILAIVGDNAIYPDFYNSVLSIRASEEIELDLNEPYIQIREINDHSIFVANKSKTFDEERKVAGKAPVDSIKIKSISKSKTNKKQIKKINNFNYIIKIGDFYFEKSAYVLKERILSETNTKNIKISSLSKTSFRVYLGPFKNLDSLKKAFDDIKSLNFENIEIIKK